LYTEECRGGAQGSLTQGTGEPFNEDQFLGHGQMFEGVSNYFQVVLGHTSIQSFNAEEGGNPLSCPPTFGATPVYHGRCIITTGLPVILSYTD
jgi:hypothetical protein